jgi:hypothetical protein
MKNKQQRMTGMADARDGVIRWASWLAAMALSAALAIPLGAEVIDDFEDGVKFLEGGGGMDYFAWEVTGGQLVVSRSSPVPTPMDKELLTYDNVYWSSPSLPAGSLDGGRTLELRMDLVHTSTDDLFLLLMSGGQNVGADSAYAVLVDRNEVALMKWRAGGNMAIFFWDTLQTAFENVTVRLALKKTESGVVITVKVVDKATAVMLYEKSFTDGPGQDAPMRPPDPHTIGMWTIDEGAPYTNFHYAAVGVWQVIRTEPPALEIQLDNLECAVYNAPEVDSVRLSWSANLVEEQIMVGADSLAEDAVWAPCPEPNYQRFGCPCVSVSTGDGAQFFKLVPGTQFIDSFNDLKQPFATRNPWEPWFHNGSDVSRFTITLADGVLKIQTQQDPVSGMVMVYSPGGGEIFRDFYASVDILDWGSSSQNSALGIAGRVQGSPSGDVTGMYLGSMQVNPAGVPGTAQLVFFDGGADRPVPGTFSITAGKAYRLQFSAVGSQLTIRLVDLTDGRTVKDGYIQDSRHTQGRVALWVNTRGSSAYARTVDNFFVTGTKP